jgi:hypothetical protein
MLRRILALCALCTLGPPLMAQSKTQPFTLSAANQCAQIAVTGQSTVGIQVTGTFTATLTPQVSVQGQSPQSTTVTPSNSPTSTASTITSTGAWRSSVGGYDTFLLCVTAYTSGSATVFLNATSVSAGAGLGAGGGGGSGTVSANNTAAGAVANYAAAGGSTTVGATTLNYVAPTLTVSTAAGGNGVLALSGNTSGTATLTAPAVAGTTGNPLVSSNAISVPTGNGNSASSILPATAANGIGFTFQSATGNWSTSDGTGPYLFGTRTLLAGQSGNQFGFVNTNNAATGTQDTCISRKAAGVLAVGNCSAAGDETAIWSSANSCRVTADITLPVNTATTVCSWSLPASAHAWAWQCEIPWVISAGSGTNTLAIIANPSQTPTAATNGFAEILTTNTGTATELTTAISASGGTTLLTSGTITPAATVFSARTSGTLLASGTAGTFAIQMTAAGTTATAAAKAGATCILY